MCRVSFSSSCTWRLSPPVASFHKKLSENQECYRGYTRIYAGISEDQSFFQSGWRNRGYEDTSGCIGLSSPAHICTRSLDHEDKVKVTVTAVMTESFMVISEPESIANLTLFSLGIVIRHFLPQFWARLGQVTAIRPGKELLPLSLESPKPS